MLFDDDPKLKAMWLTMEISVMSDFDKMGFLKLLDGACDEQREKGNMLDAAIYGKIIMDITFHRRVFLDDRLDLPAWIAIVANYMMAMHELVETGVLLPEIPGFFQWAREEAKKGK